MRVKSKYLAIMKIELDRLDLKILAIVQENNLTPHREIASSIGLSAPAVTRRLQRLRKNGVIQKNVSVLNSSALGRPLTLIVQVVAHSEQIEQLDRMRKSFEACQQIQQCYYVTGDADFILILNVSDMAEYEKLTRVLFFESENVSKFTTFVSMETVKSSSKVVI